MKITILNGNPTENNDNFENYLMETHDALEKKGHELSNLKLKDMKISSCCGCFGCWVKTPGTCKLKDDAEILLKNYIHADLAVFASPIIMGFPSAVIRKAGERLIPIYHAYLMVKNGRMGHVPRYDSFPDIGLLLQPEKETTHDDLEIISNIYKRQVFNKAKIAFLKTMDNGIEEVVDEINHI